MTHRRRKLLITLGAIAVVLLALRLALPGWLLERINERMARMGDYQGHVEGIDLFLWAGEYTLDEVTIEKRTHDIPVPFFKVRPPEIRPT